VEILSSDFGRVASIDPRVARAGTVTVVKFSRGRVSARATYAIG